MRFIGEKKNLILSSSLTDFAMACSCHTTTSFVCVVFYAQGVTAKSGFSTSDPYNANIDAMPPQGTCDGSVSTANSIVSVGDLNTCSD